LPSFDLSARLKQPRAPTTGDFRRRNGWRFCSSFGLWRTRRAIPLPEDWRQFIESLNSNGVEYLVVGAVALAHHGLPRYTGDLDILVRNSIDNCKRLESALAEFGLAALGIKATDFVDSYRVVQLGVAPNRIYLLTSLTGVTFEEAWASRVETAIGGTRVNFIGREALIQNKRLTGRAQDKADLEALGAGKERKRPSKSGRGRTRVGKY